MTIKELREFRSICGEIEHIDMLLKGKRIHVKDSVQSSATYPYNLRNVSVEGDVYESSSAKLLAKMRKLKIKKAQIEAFVNGIKDDRVRRAIEIYCIEPVGADLKTPKWSDVADIFNDGSTGDSIRMYTERWMKKFN